jgi:hypothetical protein
VDSVLKQDSSTFYVIQEVETIFIAANILWKIMMGYEGTVPLIVNFARHYNVLS